MDGNHARPTRIGELIRLQQRLALEARTIGVSLHSALDQLGEAGDRRWIEDRPARRRECCQRARQLLLEVDAHSARNRRAADIAFAGWPGSEESGERIAFRGAVRESDDAMEAARSVADADVRGGLAPPGINPGRGS
ncbi:MAG TPA: hypothetical protein VF013_08210 [Candidatus Limnocylindria bacterium]